MQEFKSFVKDVLVATDVASKGLGKYSAKKYREITFHIKKIPNQVWPYSREFYGLIQVFLLPFDLFNLSIN